MPRLSVFNKFLFSYLLILIIPLGMALIISNNFITVIRDKNNEANLANIKQCSEILDARFSELEGIAMQIALDRNINSLMNAESPLVDGTPIYRILEIQEYISSLNITNNFIDSILVYFKKGDMIVSSHDCYFRLPLFYRDHFTYGNYSAQQWNREFLSSGSQIGYKPSTPVTLNGATRDMAAYVQTIPVESFYDTRGVILIMIPEENIRKIFEPLGINNQGTAIINDYFNQTIFTSTPNTDEKFKIPNHKQEGFFYTETTTGNTVISYAVTPRNGFTYVLQKPSGVVLRDVKKIQTTVITIMITTVVLGMIFTFFLTYKNSKPIRETLTSLRNISGGEKIGTKDDFDYLKGSVSRLISSNKNLQEKIQNQRPLIQMTFLHSLLNSKFEQEEEIIDTFKEVGLPLPEKHILVAAVRILRRSSDGNSLSMDEINGVKILLKEYLEANIPFNHYSYELDIHSLIFIFHFDETIKQPKEEIKDAARMIKEHLAKYHRISVRFSGGGIYSALLQIHQSFREAEAALEYKSIPENTPVSWYSAIPCKSSGPYFPVDSEMQLITCLKAGDCSGSIKILEELYTENYINNKLSLEKEKQFVNSLIGIFNRVFAGVPFATSDPANRIMESENMPQMFSRLKELCRETCDLINKNKKSHNERLKEEVIHFIGKNYSDSMISLTSLADQFHVTAPYLSQFFKEQMGINFSVYLENMRIDEARELMQSTDLSIAEVAAQVGYNSPHVFRKAFKRKEGIKPSEYKEDQLSSMS